jgi:hypothetical protein
MFFRSAVEHVGGGGGGAVGFVLLVAHSTRERSCKCDRLAASLVDRC